MKTFTVQSHYSQRIFPFTALVGQEMMKLALILNAINPKICGVLIRGEKGTCKSTAVRALADVLPEIEVVGDCRYSCDPVDQQHMCVECRERLSRGETLPVLRHKVRVVNLPLGSTEDRVVGGIDLEETLRSGSRCFEPGVLARANRGIIYVDEVNLLDDHLANLLLDTAETGINIVEREGISFSHPAQFILVGTMNPEEGELRPQILDRFGLCVSIASIADPVKRKDIIRRRERFDDDPRGFEKEWAEDQRQLRERIVRARQMMTDTTISPDILRIISEVCLTNRTAGHRSDILIEKTARTFAAWEGRSQVTVQDVMLAAEPVLAHRSRLIGSADEGDPLDMPSAPHRDAEVANDKKPSNELEYRHETSEAALPPAFGQHELVKPNMYSSSDKDIPGQVDQSSQSLIKAYQRDDEDDEDDSLEDLTRRAARNKLAETHHDVGETFRIRPILGIQDKLSRNKSGRRTPTKSKSKVGRYVRSTTVRKNDDLAFDATIRAAAPFQHRRQRKDVAIAIEEDDIREKVRKSKMGNLLQFVVDGSGSMGNKQMTETKGAIMSMLLDAYQKRDKIGLVAFKEYSAEVLLPPTGSIELARKLLEWLPTGGKTPLATGLLKGYEVIVNHLKKDPSASPLLILVSDGKANVGLTERYEGSTWHYVAHGYGNLVKEVLTIADMIRRDKRVRTMVIDTTRKMVPNFMAKRIAEAMGAVYFRIGDLKAEGIVTAVRKHI